MRTRTIPLLLALGCPAEDIKVHGPSERGGPSDTDTTSGDSGAVHDSARDTAGDTARDTAQHTGGADTAGAPCADLPADAVTVTLPDGYGHPTAVLLASGQVAVYELPTWTDAHASEQLVFGESAGGAYSPQPVTIEFKISQCPGEISFDATDFCTAYSTNGTYNSITWFGAPHDPIVDAASANLYGYCWAPASEGPWYLSMRWTYSECAYGASTCGFMLQRNLGPY